MSVRNGLLALLTTGPRHGYELKKELEDRTGSLWELNVGQVYTTLSRLERDGLVDEVGGGSSSGPAGSGAGDGEADGRADGGARGSGQDQRQYSLTDAGRAEVHDWFAEPRLRSSPDRDELVIKLTIAASLDGHVALDGSGIDLDEIIDSQRAATIEELQGYTRLKARADEDDLARLFALDAVIAQIDGELRWLDQCQQRHAAIRPSRNRPMGSRRSPSRRPTTRSPGSRSRANDSGNSGSNPSAGTAPTAPTAPGTPTTPRTPTTPTRMTRNRGKGTT